MEQQSEHDNQPDLVSVGEALRLSREASGLSLNEVADRLKLSLRQIEAIERDDFGALPGSTFVRGFVRNYARFLEIDPAPLMDALEAQFPSAVSEVANLVRDDHPPESHDHDGEGGSSNKWLVLSLVSVVLGAAAVWIFGHRTEVQPDVTPVVSQQTASDAMLAASAPPVPASVPLAAAKPASAVAQVSTQPKAVTASNKAASSGAASTGEAATGKVTVSVEEPSWVSVVDAQGHKLIYTIVAPGAPRDVSGVAPFKVRIGNAGKVTLSYNGKAVDISSRIIGSTANLELK